MKLIKAFVLGLLFLAACSAFAEGEFGNIHKGNVQVGGSLRFDQVFASSYEGYSSLYLSTVSEYFLIDRFSLGGRLFYSHNFSNSDFSNYGIGPSATWYFWTQDRLAAFSNLNFNYFKGAFSPYYFDLVANLGMNYFITPSVAVSPVLQYSHTFGRDGISTVNTLGLVVAFSIYL